MYFNQGYVDTDYGGPDYFSYAASGVTPSVSAYVGPRYLAERYSHRNYVDSLQLAGTSFNGVGTRAEISITGFSGGLLWIQQGTSASTGLESYYPGFAPDPGGILDNDSDPDGDPLSYTVVTQPEAGTLSAYAGGAFDWTIPVATPVGRYSWTYQIYAGGEAGNVATVTLDHGDLFASTAVQGFAGDFNFDFQEAGTPCTLFVTGFGGQILLTFDKQGTSASQTVLGNPGTISFGFQPLGLMGTVGVQGFAGSGTFDAFIEPGTIGTVNVQGFAGTLNTGTFFNDAGTAADVGTQGFAGSLLQSLFNEQGIRGTVTQQGFGTNILFGFESAGTTGTVNVQGSDAFTPLTEQTSDAFVRGRRGHNVALRRTRGHDAAVGGRT